MTCRTTLAGEQNRHHRERLARHLVQRRRSDIARYLQTDTYFPNRQEAELTYNLSVEYRRLFEDVLAYARQSVRSPVSGQHQQRMRWWSALGLLRTLASSPAAAAATMRNRTVTAEAETVDGVDDIGRRALLDMDETEEGVDVVPGSVTGETESRRLRDFARQADQLRGAGDHKLLQIVPVVQELLKDGFRPVVFCRFIETAEYLGAELRKRLRTRPRAEVLVTTGLLPPAERQARVAELLDHKNAVLVTTDCLSEGINLQEYRNAVVHYDLPWNPTRLEQREGRVDRFGQTHDVRLVTYWGEDNLIDESVLKVLLRKHRAIRGALGVSIPVPGATNTVIEALTENVLLGADMPAQRRFGWMNDMLRPHSETLELQWEHARQAETKRRSLFAQHTINPDHVAAELDAMRKAVGSGTDVEQFVTTVLTGHGAVLQPTDNTADAVFDLSRLDPATRDALATDETTVTGSVLPTRNRQCRSMVPYPSVGGGTGRSCARLRPRPDPRRGNTSGPLWGDAHQPCERNTPLCFCAAPA